MIISSICICILPSTEVLPDSVAYPLIHSLHTCSERQRWKNPLSQIFKLPSRELTYPTLGKGKPSSKVLWDGILLMDGNPAPPGMDA